MTEATNPPHGSVNPTKATPRFYAFYMLGVIAIVIVTMLVNGASGNPNQVIPSTLAESMFQALVQFDGVLLGLLGVAFGVAIGRDIRERVNYNYTLVQLLTIFVIAILFLYAIVISFVDLAGTTSQIIWSEFAVPLALSVASVLLFFLAITATLYLRFGDHVRDAADKAGGTAATRNLKGSKRPILVALVVFLLISLAILSLGATYFFDYSASQNSATEIRSGTVLAFNSNSSSIQNLGFHLVIDIPNRQFTVIWDWGQITPGDYGFVTLLPVTLISPANGTNGWYYHNVKGNGSWISVVIHDTQQNLTNEIAMQFGTTDSLVSGDHGSYSFYLPAGEDMPEGLGASVRNLNGNPLNARFPYHVFKGIVTISIGTSERDTPIFVYPPTATPTSSHYELGSGPPHQSYFWTFPTLQAIILNYQDTTQAQHYQGDLFWSGLLLGVGIPSVLGSVLELARTTASNEDSPPPTKR